VNEAGNVMKNEKLETATFAAGCFWGVQAAFDDVKGVKSTTVGYTGGWTNNPSYEDVCSDRTGHAEAVEVKFDPSEVSFKSLLEVFFENHDPTTLNCQGLDVGSQYRSAVFFHSPEQKRLAEKSKEELEKSKRFKNKIVTEIVPAKEFFAAEDYHQKYLQKHGKAVC